MAKFVLYPIENRCRFIKNREMACEGPWDAQPEPGSSVSKPGIIPEETGEMDGSTASCGGKNEREGE